MRTTSISTVIFATLLALASCTREMAPSRVISLEAGCGDDAKVFLNGDRKTVWNAGDQVSVFYGGDSRNLCGKFTGADGAASGYVEFETESDIPSGNTFALIPYSSGCKLSGSTLNSSIPKEQAYRDGSYAKDAAVLVAKTSDQRLTFRYANAVIALELESNSSLPIGIRQIVLRSAAGEALAGDISIDMTAADSLDVTLSGSGCDSIVMKSGTGNICTIASGTTNTFFFCVAPGVLESGYRFDITLENGEVRTVRSTFRTLLQAGRVETVRNCISITKRITIDFDELKWTPAFPSSKKTTDSTGVTHSFTNPDDGKTYNIVACSTEGGYYASGVFLRFNSVGDWLKLPMMSGMRLYGFGAMVRQTSSKAMGVSSTPNYTGDVVPSTSYTTDQMVYSIVGGDVHEVYINIVSTNTQIMRIELLFE